MKIQLEQLDLLRPWPHFSLHHGYSAIQILVQIGATPIGELTMRPRRKPIVFHRRLRARIARLFADDILSALARLGTAAGPEALKWFLPHAWPDFDLARCNARDRQQYVARYLLDQTGIPSPFRDWAKLAENPSVQPAVTVAICTRDRADALDVLLTQLKQLDYPDYDILVIDNSADAVPTQQVVERHAVSYIRVATPGLSRARNAALTHARAPWIAFIDDDARPAHNWLKELVRPTADHNCRAVCGLTLPAHLQSSAEIARHRFDRPTRHFAPAIVSTADLSTDQFAGAGTNLLLHRPFAQALGGFDNELGPGPHSIAPGEDADLLDRILRASGNVHIQPSATVKSEQTTSQKQLRKHVRDRAAGRAVLLIRRAFATDRTALRKLVYHAPTIMLRNILAAVRGQSPVPFSLTLVQLRATLTAPTRYAIHRLGRLFRPQRATEPRLTPQFTPTPKSGEERSQLNPRIAA